MRRLPLLAAYVVALGLVASGCGGSAGAIPELASLTQVATSSASADTAKFALTFEMSLPGADQALSFGANGGFDTPAKRSQLTVDLSSLAELMKQFGSNLGGKVTGDLGDAADWKLEVITDGDVVYLQFPLIAKQLPNGKTWVKGNARDFSKADTSGLDQFGSLSGMDPRDVFGFLKAVSGSIEAVGSEEVRGVETSHYRATLDPAKLTELVPAGQREALGGVDDAARLAGITELPLDVWIDSENRIRKLSIELDAKRPGSDESVEASFVVELYDYGMPLALDLPPADQVADAATLKPGTS
ncbi:hypothetical protein [Gaiella sp.]|uniref:hypothetical protein n=1 Tax=Gaiella sp. TaxID=2663207 RepID=UPI003263FAA7